MFIGNGFFQEVKYQGSPLGNRLEYLFELLLSNESEEVASELGCILTQIDNAHNMQTLIATLERIIKVNGEKTEQIYQTVNTILTNILNSQRRLLVMPSIPCVNLSKTAASAKPVQHSPQYLKTPATPPSPSTPTTASPTSSPAARFG